MLPGALVRQFPAPRAPRCVLTCVDCRPLSFTLSFTLSAPGVVCACRCGAQLRLVRPRLWLVVLPTLMLALTRLGRRDDCECGDCEFCGKGDPDDSVAIEPEDDTAATPADGVTGDPATTASPAAAEADASAWRVGLVVCTAACLAGHDSVFICLALCVCGSVCVAVCVAVCVWLCGCVAVAVCVAVCVWLCGYVAVWLWLWLWLCGYVAVWLWLCGCVVATWLWLCMVRFTARRSRGHGVRDQRSGIQHCCW